MFSVPAQSLDEVMVIYAEAIALNPDNLSKLEDIETQLESLQSQYRFWKLAVAILALGLLFMVANPPRIRSEPQVNRFGDIECTSVRLIDKRSAVRAELSVQDNGTAELVFYDNTFQIRAAVATKSDGTPLFALYDRGDKARFLSCIDLKGDATVATIGRDTVSGVSLVSPRDGGAVLIMCPADGKPRISMAVGPDGSSSIEKKDDPAN